MKSGFAEGVIIKHLHFEFAEEDLIEAPLPGGASKETVSCCHRRCVFICERFSFTHSMFHLQPHFIPLTPPCLLSLPSGLGLDSEWVTLLFTIFQIPSQVFGLAGCPAFSLAITGLRGFSNGAFEEITLFSPSSREKTETFGQQLVQSITQTELKLCLTHLATKISSYLVCL